MKKTLACLLAFMMCFTALISCGKENTDTETTTASDVTTTASQANTTTTAQTESLYDSRGYLKDDLDPALNYGGETFSILYWEDVERLEFEVKEQTGDLIADALYHRNALVEERLGIDFEWFGTPGNWGNQASFISKISNDINSGGTYDVFAGYSMTGATMAMQSLSRNLSDMEHMNFEQPWWPSSLTDLSTINGRLYFCSGDISTNMLHMMYCTIFNKDMAEELKIPNLYDIVDQGTWTLSKVAELASVAYDDVNGNTMTDYSDRYGFALGNEIHFDAFFTAAGLRTIIKDENGMPIVADEFGSERTQAVLEDVVEIFHNNNYAAFPKKISGWNNVPFAEGRVLFILDRNYVTSSGTFANTAVTYGVLPVPKYDEAQEDYYTCMAFPFTVYAVSMALNEEEAQRAGAVLECMASESYRQVTPAVFEMAMKLKYASDDDDSRMYDLIRDTIQIDLGRIFNTPLRQIPCQLFRTAANNGSTGWAALYKAESKPLEKALATITKSISERADQAS